MQLNGHARRDETETPPGPVRTWENLGKRSPRGNQGDATESWNPRCAYVFVGQSFADFRRVRAEIFWKDPSGSERARFPLITAGNGTILSCKMQEDSGLSLFCARSPAIRVHQECPKPDSRHLCAMNAAFASGSSRLMSAIRCSLEG